MAIHSFTLVPAAYVLLLRERDAGAPEVLLQLRRSTGYMDGYWACGAAGHVEADESVLRTAARETHEELGLQVEERALEPLTAMHRTGDLGGAPIEQRVDFFLVLRDWDGEPAVQEPEKNGGLAWFALDALPDLVPPHERVVLGLLATSLEPGGAPVPPITTFGFRAGEDVELYREAREH
ncbi:NUDIX domain-containing protein [Actinomyces haliotis]|uniref:NUDIX domain-containing protein n=1 Tax=Actinomyces haliotis TaxID=1280843 RepID=UPI00188EF32D|nr:NUDIX domain-containing protein [Actinomyces haliotis]